MLFINTLLILLVYILKVFIPRQLYTIYWRNLNDSLNNGYLDRAFLRGGEEESMERPLVR